MLGDIKSEKNSPKLELLKSFILKQEIDVISLAEVNTVWRKIPTSRNLWARTDGWFRNRQISLGNNTRFPPESEFQIGGTITMTVEDVAPWVIETGSDSRSLGRWSWIRTCGKDNLTTRFVTCYCPVKSANPGGAYSQKLSSLAFDGISDTCPRDQFWMNLATDITR